VFFPAQATIHGLPPYRGVAVRGVRLSLEEVREREGERRRGDPREFQTTHPAWRRRDLGRRVPACLIESPSRRQVFHDAKRRYRLIPRVPDADSYFYPVRGNPIDMPLEFDLFRGCLDLGGCRRDGGATRRSLVRRGRRWGTFLATLTAEDKQ